MKGITSLNSSTLRLWWAALPLKVLFAALLPLTADETYYWVWSWFPDWSYYDHPAMTAWLFRLAPYLQSVPGLSRLPFVVMGHLSVLLWLQLAAPYLLGKNQTLLLLLLLLHPFTGLGSMLGTPDVPLIFWWTVGLYLLNRIQNEGRLRDFVLLGAALGLGFCSKYMMVLFVPALGLHFLGAKPIERSQLLRGAGLTFVVGFIFSLPVIYWNIQNDWVSIKFQADHGLGASQWNPKWTLEYLSGQLLLLFPLLLISLGRYRPPAQLKWLYPYAFLPVLFFALTTFRGHVEANWPVAGYPVFLVLVATGADLHNKKLLVNLSLAIFGLLNLLAISEGLHHWLPVEKKRIKIHDFDRYVDLTRDAQVLTAEGETVFTGSYQMASVMTFQAGTLYPKLPGINRRDFYDEIGTKVPDRFYAFVIIWYDLPEKYKELGYEVVSEKTYGNDYKLLEVERR